MPDTFTRYPYPAQLAAMEAEAAGDDAMDRALALAAAAGRADGIAARATVPFDPALCNLRYRLLLWAACTRDERLRDWLPEYRRRARNAIACYRALRAEPPAVTDDRRAA